MAEVALPGSQHRHTGSISAIDTGAMLRSAPRIEMVANSDFAFPALPSRTPSLQPPMPEMRRPVSMHSNSPPLHPQSIAHRRAQSTLPSFSFNSADSTGLKEAFTPPLTPDLDEVPTTPTSKRGHRRRGSEFVGGDSRLGVEGAISSSPTKPSMLPLPTAPTGPPAGRRGHAHRRSGALSSHDVRSIMQPSESEPRLSSSLPVTPLEQPSQSPTLDRAISAPDVTTEPTDAFDPSLDADEGRPSSRRARFAEDVEIIPRPLSTISSEDGSSISTVRGHMQHSSISSVMSQNTPSPPSKRQHVPKRASLGITFENDISQRTRSSLEISKRIEKEGEWLMSSRSSQSLPRPSSESVAAEAAPALAFANSEMPVRSRQVQKRHSLSQALRLDRRKSEPAISLKLGDQSRLSSTSLHGDVDHSQSATAVKASHGLERRNSRRKIRDWAISKLSKKGKEVKGLPDEAPQNPDRSGSAGDASVPGRVPTPEPPAAETDLDAVFSTQPSEVNALRSDSHVHPRIEVSTPTPSYVSSFQSHDSDESSPVLDLDAALGPFKTPSMGGYKPRRELHSSRPTKDFGGPGLNYHRRAESAPELPPFSRGSMVSQSSLPDVFEGEGEEEAESDEALRPVSSDSAQDEEAGVGIQVVDADSAQAGSWGFGDGLRIQSGEWEPERPSTSYGNMSSRLSTPSNERRPSSIIDQTIVEESSPVEALQIVEAHEEPRTSSLTKSSDSSETPTLIAAQSGMLTLPDSSQSVMTPDTYQTSTFSSPDFSRRQGSFDNTSRVGTSASSITDNRTMSSCTGDQSHEVRASVDDVPSLTSSRSTMMSNMQANGSRRDLGGSTDRVASVPTLDPVVAAERRRKRASIQSLSQLMGGSFGSKSKLADDLRPQTAIDPAVAKAPKTKEHRLKKLMFWRSKSRQNLHSTS